MCVICVHVHVFMHVCVYKHVCVCVCVYRCVCVCAWDVCFDVHVHFVYIHLPGSTYHIVFFPADSKDGRGQTNTVAGGGAADGGEQGYVLVLSALRDNSAAFSRERRG